MFCLHSLQRMRKSKSLRIIRAWHWSCDTLCTLFTTLVNFLTILDYPFLTPLFFLGLPIVPCSLGSKARHHGLLLFRYQNWGAINTFLHASHVRGTLSLNSSEWWQHWTIHPPKNYRIPSFLTPSFSLNYPLCLAVSVARPGTMTCFCLVNTTTTQKLC